MVTEVLQHRNLIKQFTLRDLKLKYERSVLGFLWSLLNPLVMILIYTFFFSMVVRIDVGVPYWMFLVTFLLPWQFFAKGVLSVSPLPYQNGFLLNRAVFPAESLVFSGMLSAFVDFILEMSILVIILALLGVDIFPWVLILPLIMALHFLFTTGVVFVFSVAHVFYRDTQYIAGIVCLAWMYLSPVFYVASMVPDQFRLLYNLNPMVYISEGFRQPLCAGALPHIATMLTITGVSCAVFILGWMFFNRYKRRFPEMV